jgi:hypothetical protein
MCECGFKVQKVMKVHLHLRLFIAISVILEYRKRIDHLLFVVAKMSNLGDVVKLSLYLRFLNKMLW